MSIECGNEADVLLQKAGVESGVAVECAEIQDSEDFFVTDVSESCVRIAIDFEMPFILCANNKYRIEIVEERYGFSLWIVEETRREIENIWFFR